jgi:hypothetical protein
MHAWLMRSRALCDEKPEAFLVTDSQALHDPMVDMRLR